MTGPYRFLQLGIGKTLTRFGQGGSLRTGQGMPSCRLAQVSWVPSCHLIVNDSFIVGARACLGRRYEQTWSLTRRLSTYTCLLFFYFRFFETESVAAITMMILKYGIEVKEEPEFIGETFEQRFARITSSEQYLSNTYAIPSLSCLPRPEFLSAPIACRWYSRGDNYLPES